MLKRLRLLIATVCVSAMLAAPACKVVQYRQIQATFDAAAQADNLRSADSIGSLTGGDKRMYQQVIDRLPNDYIDTEVDEQFRTNAYMIRAVAEWRTGQFGAADKTAKRGLRGADAVAKDRDEVVLRMIPALVIDEEQQINFMAAGGRLTKAQYDAYAKAYLTAHDELLRVAAAIGAPVLPDVRYFVAYHHWRILQNWRLVVDQVEPENNLLHMWLHTTTCVDLCKRAGASACPDRPAQPAAGTRASELAQDHPLYVANQACDGKWLLRDVAKAYAKTIPDAHPLRRLIVVLGG